MKGNPRFDGLIRTIELNKAHIDIYKDSVIFHDDETDESWEHDWKDLWGMTKVDYEFVSD